MSRVAILNGCARVLQARYVAHRHLRAIETGRPIPKRRKGIKVKPAPGSLALADEENG